MGGAISGKSAHEFILRQDRTHDNPLVVHRGIDVSAGVAHGRQCIVELVLGYIRQINGANFFHAADSAGSINDVISNLKHMSLLSGNFLSFHPVFFTTLILPPFLKNCKLFLKFFYNISKIMRERATK